MLVRTVVINPMVACQTISRGIIQFLPLIVRSGYAGYIRGKKAEIPPAFS
jgi:hypothetical protein